MTKEDALHLQIKSRFTDFLKAAELPYWKPALTVCPHCGEHAGILMDFMWSCQHCNKRGGVDGSLVMIKDERMDNRAKLYVTGRDTLDMELELIFDQASSTWQFLGYGGKERIQKRDRLLSVINDFLIDDGPFHGTASELLTLLSARTELQIKSANALTRLLNPQKALLQYEYGILYNFERTGKKRTLHLTRIPDNDSDDTLTLSTDTVTIVTT